MRNWLLNNLVAHYNIALPRSTKLDERKKQQTDKTVFSSLKVELDVQPVCMPHFPG